MFLRNNMWKHSFNICREVIQHCTARRSSQPFTSIERQRLIEEWRILLWQVAESPLTTHIFGIDCSFNKVRVYTASI